MACSLGLPDVGVGLAPPAGDGVVPGGPSRGRDAVPAQGRGGTNAPVWALVCLLVQQVPKPLPRDLEFPQRCPVYEAF